MKRIRLPLVPGASALKDPSSLDFMHWQRQRLYHGWAAPTQGILEGEHAHLIHY